MCVYLFLSILFFTIRNCRIHHLAIKYGQNSALQVRIHVGERAAETQDFTWTREKTPFENDLERFI